MCECDKGRELFVEMMALFTESPCDVAGKITCAKAGITYFSELIRVAFPEDGEKIALDAAGIEGMAMVNAIADDGVH